MLAFLPSGKAAPNQTGVWSLHQSRGADRVPGVNEKALGDTFRAIIANNRAGGWGRIKRGP